MKFFMLSESIRLDNLKCVHLPHSTKKERSRLLYVTDQSLYEATMFATKYGSWLCGDFLRNDNSLTMVTEIDPAFVVFLLLDDTLDKMKLLLMPDVLTNTEYPSLKLLEPFLCKQELLDSVCHWKTCDDAIACRLDEGYFLVI